jgi:hypothetical protein
MIADNSGLYPRRVFIWRPTKALHKVLKNASKSKCSSLFWSYTKNKEKSFTSATLLTHVLSIFNHGYEDQLRRKTYLIG